MLKSAQSARVLTTGRAIMNFCIQNLVTVAARFSMNCIQNTVGNLEDKGREESPMMMQSNAT